MNKAYFNYLVRSKRNISIFLGIVNLIFPTLMYFVSYNIHDNAFVAQSIIHYSTFLLLLECYILPIACLNFIQNKSSVDTYYALPLSKKKIYITTFIYIVSEIVLLHVIAIIPVLLTQMININLVNILIYIVLMIFVISAIVLAVMAIIFRANSFFDMIALLGLYTFLPLFFELVIEVFSSSVLYGVSRSTLVEFSYFFLPTLFIQSFQVFLFKSFRFNSEFNNFMYLDYKVCLLLIGFIGLVALVLLVHSYKTRKAEDAEQISDNLLSYPLLITVITISLILSVVLLKNAISSTILYLALIFVLYLIMVFIYKRKIKITKQSIVLFLISILFGYGFMYASDTTEGFGLSRLYEKYDELNHFYYSFDIYKEGVDYYVNVELSDNLKNKPIKGELIEYLHSHQDRYVTSYYEGLNKNNSYSSEDVRVYENMSIVYRDNKRFNYGVSHSFNLSNVDYLLEVVEKFDEYNFIDVTIHYNYYDNEEYEYGEITIQELRELLYEELGV